MDEQKIVPAILAAGILAARGPQRIGHTILPDSESAVGVYHACLAALANWKPEQPPEQPPEPPRSE